MSKTSKPPTTSAAKADDSTKDLVLRAKVGDRLAENEIVRRSLPRMRRFAHGRLPPAVRNGYDTEDIVQDSLLQTLQRLPVSIRRVPEDCRHTSGWRCRTRSRMRFAGGHDSDRSRTWPNRWTVVRHRTMRSRRRSSRLGRRPCSTGCVRRIGRCSWRESSSATTTPRSRVSSASLRRTPRVSPSIARFIAPSTRRNQFRVQGPVEP